MSNSFFLCFGLALSSLALVRCATVGTVIAQRPLALAGDQGRWVGAVRSDDAMCGPQRTGVMVIGPEEFAFDPFQGTLTVRGKRDDGGSLAGTASGGAAGGLTLEFKGRVVTDPANGQQIVGVLTSRRCTWQVDLHRG